MRPLPDQDYLDAAFAAGINVVKLNNNWYLVEPDTHPNSNRVQWQPRMDAYDSRLLQALCKIELMFDEDHGDNNKLYCTARSSDDPSICTCFVYESEVNGGIVYASNDAVFLVAVDIGRRKRLLNE